MKLYHGSYIDILQIDLKKTMKGKDFGQGFYLTSDLEQAKGIAKIRSMSFKATPCVNVYEIDESILNSGELKIKFFENYSPEWAEFVLANRKNISEEPIHDFDIVIGPVANDRVGQQIRRFTDGEITMDEFINRLKYMKGITTQYFFGTTAAIRHLNKLDSIIP